jgi:hypothetical protein
MTLAACGSLGRPGRPSRLAAQAGAGVHRRFLFKPAQAPASRHSRSQVRIREDQVSWLPWDDLPDWWNDSIDTLALFELQTDTETEHRVRVGQQHGLYSFPLKKLPPYTLTGLDLMTHSSSLLADRRRRHHYVSRCTSFLFASLVR